MLYFILVLLLMNACSTIDGSNRSTLKSHQRKKPFAALVFSSSTNLTPSDKESCQWLSRLKHQSKICWKRGGLAEVLLDAKNLSVTHCQTQFEFDRWNCSKRDSFFKNIYRETAFMYSMASSALMFSVARACSEGTLAGCSCGDHGKPSNSKKWQWGGCGDNTKYAKKFTRKFLQLRKKGDGFNSIVNYNTEMGIKVVQENEKKDCRCHGVSASCTIKICFKKIGPFEDISKQLKSLYHNAIQVQPQNDFRAFKNDKDSRELLYLESSPNFCMSTVGRYCNNTDNCATVCCGRGFYSTEIELVRKCNCRWHQEIFDVKCDDCKEKKLLLKCK